MKYIFVMGFVFVVAIRLHGQSQVADIVLSSKDVDTNSVRIITAPDQQIQNVVANCVGKTSEEIKAICDNPKTRVLVMKEGIVVAETKQGYCGCIVKNQTNHIGFVLMFEKYDQARAVERALRGE